MLATALVLASLTQSATYDATYHWTLNPEEETVHVVARFDLTSSSELPRTVEFALPEGATFLQIDDALLDGPIRAENVKGTPLAIEELDALHWRVSAGATHSILLKYSIALFHRTHPDVGPRHAYEYPYLTEDHGMLMTYCLVIHPTNLEFNSARVVVEGPAGWKTIAPWPPCDPSERGGFAPPTLQSLTNDILAVGAWETEVVSVDAFEAVLAVAPGQTGLLDIVADPLSRIVRHELALFGRPMDGGYLFLFGRPDMPNGFSGSPKTRSMTLMVGKGMVASANEFVPHLVAHEFFHTWAASVTNLPDELRWLNEGVTDYYAYRISSEVGLVPWSRFTETIGEKLTAVERNEFHGRLSLAAVGGPVFFEDGAAGQYCYDAGFVMGVLLDRELRLRGVEHGLDTLLRAFLNDDAWQNPTNQPDLDAFLHVLTRHTDESFAADVRQLLFDADGPDFTSVLQASGMPVQRDSDTKPHITLPRNWTWQSNPSSSD